MISLAIVAGDKAQSLAKYFSDRGTFSVEYVYGSMAAQASDIRRSIIRVDKLLIYAQRESMDTRQEMLLLRELLNESGFFKVNEIVFVIDKNDEETHQYCKSVMADTGFKSYSILDSEVGKTSYTDVYNELLGVTDSLNFDNTRKRVYRVEKNSNAKVAFEPQDNRDLVVEPGTAAPTYRKDMAAKLENRIAKEPKGSEVGIYRSVSFDSIQAEPIPTPFWIVSGYEKSGITTLACALAVSASKVEEKVLLIDLTKKGDAVDRLGEVAQVTPFDVITKGCEPGISVCKVEDSVRRPFLTLQKMCGYRCIMCVDRDYLERVCAICIGGVDRTILCCSAITRDVEVTLPYFDVCKGERFLYLSELLGGESYEYASSIREIVPNDVKVISPLNLSSLDLDETLYTTIGGK